MTVHSKKVYIAADIFIAFLDRTHEKHTQASAFFRYFSREHYQLFTDILSLYLASELIQRDMSISIAKDFLRTSYLSDITILYPDESDMKAALKILINDKSNERTLTKTLMIVLADRRKIPQIATMDFLQTMFGLTIFYLPI